MNVGNRGNFIAPSREELIGNFALDAWEEVPLTMLKGLDTLDDDQRVIVCAAIQFGVRVACAVLGETGTYEQEYQAMLAKLRAQEGTQR